MVWATIWTGGRTELVLMERDPDAPRNGYTARSYLQILNSQLPDEWFEEMLFVQDNAPIHTANMVKEWFETHSITLVEWPPNSSDLNPIDQVWAMLKQQLLGRCPRLLNAGRSEEVIEQLQKNPSRNLATAGSG